MQITSKQQIKSESKNVYVEWCKIFLFVKQKIYVFKVYMISTGKM